MEHFYGKKSCSFLLYLRQVLIQNEIPSFGSLVPNRHASSEDYRYGFNNKEKDDEVKGEGDSYDYGARMYDPRVGRFFKVDTKWQQFPEWSPYVYAFDNPIRLIDVDGEGPGDPMFHQFLTTTAISIYNAAISKGASGKGALLIMAQASIESRYGVDAAKRGDYNLFGTMTCKTCSDFKKTTSHGKIKDYSNKGGYQASIDDYFDKKIKIWFGVSDLIKKESFSSDDIDKAFYTGKYIEDEKTRNTTNHGSYNFNDVITSKPDGKGDILSNNNHYGKSLLNQMNDFSVRFFKSIDYQVNKNNEAIKEASVLLNSSVITNKERERLTTEITAKTNENQKLLEIKKNISE